MSHGSTTINVYNQFMRQHLAIFVTIFLLGGCSLIYNPDNIHKPADAKPFFDAPIDAEIITDVNPAALELDDLAPTAIFEGQGTSNSRPCILVVRGHQMLDATITVAPTTANPLVTLTLGTQMVSPDHNEIAVEVTAAVMPTVNAGPNIPLTVTVTQTGATQSLPWALTPLDQFPTGATIDVSTLKPSYSSVTISSAVTFTGATQAIIVSMSSITTTAAISASASGATSGPGGCDGGVASSVGACAGGGGLGTSGGGGGAGFAAVGTNGGGSSGVGAGGAATGDPLIATYNGHPVGSLSANKASGGGGGAGGIGGGGTGGGGGGTIELTAGGDVTISGITVNGSVGGAASGVGNSGGGGGAGGVILLRSGSTIAMGSVALSAQGQLGGAGGVAGSAGGAGALGRIRFDAPATPTIPGGTLPAPHRGPAFVTPPTITTTQRPTLSLIGTANDGYSYVLHDQDGNQQDMGSGRSFGNDGTDSFVPVLTAGDNEVCVIVAGGVYTDPEAKDCVHIAFMPGM